MISTDDEISQTTNILAKKPSARVDEDDARLKAVDLVAAVEGEGPDCTPSYFVERNEFLSTISRMVKGNLVLHERDLECFMLLVKIRKKPSWYLIHTYEPF